MYKRTNFQSEKFLNKLKKCSYTEAFIDYNVDKDCTYCIDCIERQQDDNQIYFDVLYNYTMRCKCGNTLYATKHSHRSNGVKKFMVHYCCDKDGCNFHHCFTKYDWFIYVFRCSLDCFQGISLPKFGSKRFIAEYSFMYNLIQCPKMKRYCKFVIDRYSKQHN